MRVSTKGQLKEGHSIEVQTRNILDRYDGAEIRVEQYTGTTIDRPIFNKLIEDLKQGDTLVVTKLDRLARNTVEGISIVQELFNKGISVHVINVGLLENTIIERTQTGKAIAKTKEGFKEGRPKIYTSKQINNAIEMLKNNSYTAVAEITVISKSTLIRGVRKRKV
ncbi:recombinase family protein [Clostridium sp. CM027]|uniref:recombinase family protein n=1 Tax=Clostridium sp. CM027 TaxID=2849865 RepID=UPI001C6F1F0A|nr:recombinase family protein [Clostridium sp. CM027]MBW9146759.1 recombinase family protein [Clostridium sp. CM027]UVE42608.1 recombinase family protein [Clostridium sp. CM027]